MPKEKPLLEQAIVLLEEFRKYDADMPIQRAVVFLVIANSPRITMEKIAKTLNIGNSSVSRNVSALSHWGWGKQPGLDWVSTEDDPEERRRKIIELTPKGQRVLTALLDILHKEK